MSTLAPGLLVAAPPMGDPRFERSVVWLAAHDEEGAFGWIINGSELMTFPELLRRADMPPAVGVPPAGGVRRGGPVGSEQIWLLYPTAHRLDGVDDQLDVGAGVTASSSRKLLSCLVEGTAPDPMLGVAGYAGWGPSQLEEEIRSGSWLPTDASATLLFDVPADEAWFKAFERVGTSPIAFTSRVVGSA